MINKKTKLFLVLLVFVILLFLCFIALINKPKLVAKADTGVVITQEPAGIFNAKQGVIYKIVSPKSDVSLAFMDGLGYWCVPSYPNIDDPIYKDSEVIPYKSLEQLASEEPDLFSKPELNEYGLYESKATIKSNGDLYVKYLSKDNKYEETSQTVKDIDWVGPKIDSYYGVDETYSYLNNGKLELTIELKFTDYSKVKLLSATSGVKSVEIFFMSKSLEGVYINLAEEADSEQKEAKIEEIRNNLTPETIITFNSETMNFADAVEIPINKTGFYYYYAVDKVDNATIGKLCEFIDPDEYIVNDITIDGKTYDYLPLNDFINNRLGRINKENKTYTFGNDKIVVISDYVMSKYNNSIFELISVFATNTEGKPSSSNQEKIDAYFYFLSFEKNFEKQLESPQYKENIVSTGGFVGEVSIVNLEEALKPLSGDLIETEFKITEVNVDELSDSVKSLNNSATANTVYKIEYIVKLNDTESPALTKELYKIRLKLASVYSYASIVKMEYDGKAAQVDLDMFVDYYLFTSQNSRAEFYLFVHEQPEKSKMFWGWIAISMSFVLIVSGIVFVSCANKKRTTKSNSTSNNDIQVPQDFNNDEK